MLIVSPNKMFLNTIDVPVKRIHFDYKYLKQSFRERGIKSDYLKEHIESISWSPFPHTLEVTPTEFINEWFESYPNCKEYSIFYEKWDTIEIWNFLNLWEMNYKKLSNTILHYWYCLVTEQFESLILSFCLKLSKLKLDIQD